MNLLLYASTRNKRKRGKIESITADFGLMQIANMLFMGSISKRETKELEHALLATLNAKTDVLIISPLCSSCVREIKHKNEMLRRMNINRFEKDFEVY